MTEDPGPGRGIRAGVQRLFRLRLRTPAMARDDADAELDAFLEARVEHLVARGMPPGAARAEALRRLGAPEADVRVDLRRSAERRERTLGLREWVGGLLRDLRYAARGLVRERWFSAFAVGSLALGIGANTAMFTIADALVLRALPVPHAERLVLLASDATRYGVWWTNPIWEAVRDRPALHDGAFAYATTRFDLARGGAADPVEGLWASGRMFEVLGVPAALGRTFTAADDQPGGGPHGPVAVISHAFWQRRFGGAPDVLGRTLTLNRVPVTVVGVAPRGFFGPDVGRAFDVAVPLGAAPLVKGNPGTLAARDAWWLHVMLRLAPDQPLAQAAAMLRTAQPQIADETRPLDQRAEGAAQHLARPLQLRPAAGGSSELRDDYRRPVFALLGIVGLTLLVACGNIANLLLARATARRHELSVRTALGASGARLGRQLFAESLALSLAGAGLGLLVAVLGSRLIVAQLSTATDRVFLPVGIDGRMLAFTAVVAVGTALLFGTMPAVRAARIAPIEAMKDVGRGTSSGRRVGLAGALVAVQVALSLVLLVGAGLFLRSFAALATRDVGFEPDRTLLVRVDAGRTRAVIATGIAGGPGTTNSGARAALYDRLRQAALAVPGVSRAALSVTVPFGDNTMIQTVELPGGIVLPDAERRVHVNVVGPGWFGAMGTPLVAGRDVDARDREGAPRAVVVNRAFARKFFGAANPVGRLLRERAVPGATPAPLEIVGVVGDAAYRSLRDPAPPTLYRALAQEPTLPPTIQLTVRAAAPGTPAALARSVGAAVASVDRDLSLVVRPLADQVGAAAARERLLATLSGFFGALALLLAALGLYGVTAYAVARRRVELGIRMALGTTPTGIVRLVLARVAVLVAGGVAAGAAVAWWAASLVGSLVHGLTPHDPVTLAGAAALLAGVALVAGGLPARRAARLSPARVLHDG
jgi:predicted permease